VNLTLEIYKLFRV